MVGLVVVGLIVFGVLYNGGTRQETLSKPIKIGLVVPLTGDVAVYGDQAVLAVNVAVNEINSQGGVNGRKLEVVVEDGQCDPKAALNAVNKLVMVDKPAAILPLCSSEVLSVAPMAEQNKIVVLAPGATNPKITDAGDFVFRLSPSDSYQGKFIAEYVYNTLGKKKVAIIFNSDTEWSVGVKEVFKNRYLALGGTIVAEEGVLYTSNDYRAVISKIKSTDPELIYFPSMINAAIVGLKQMSELGLSVPVIGGDVWDDVKIPQTLGPSANGTRFSVMANKQLPESFITEMAKDARGKDLNAYSPRFYDAIKVLASVMDKAGDDTSAIKDQLYKLKGYVGISDVYTMDQNGDLDRASYAIKEFRNGQIVEIK